MKHLAIIALAAPMLTGCLATLDGKMDNRIACTAAGDKLYAISEYGPLGITSRISDADRKVVCKEPKPVEAAAAPTK